MGSLSINFLSSCGQQVYSACSGIYDKTKSSCSKIASRSLENTAYWTACLGYKLESSYILNKVIELKYGVPFENTFVSNLHLASLFGTLADVKGVIDNGGNPKAIDREGNTPLHFSVYARTGEVYNLLHSKGADLEAKNIYGWTPLHVAVKCNDVETAIALLNMGANVNAKTKFGNTPLHLAVKDENKPMIRALISKGADIYARNLDGLSSLQTSIDILSILHNAESHPAFSSNASLNSYFDKIFPPSREQLPKDLAWLEKMKKQLNGGKNPFEELELMYSRRGTAAFENDTKAMQILKAVTMLESSKALSAPSLHKIIVYMEQYSPLYIKVYQLASREKKWELGEVKNAPWSACVHHYEHKISIREKRPMYSKARSLLFETLNALQYERYRRLDKLAEQGILNREEFALLKEYCEYDTHLWCSRIVGEEAKNFEELWKFTNSPKSCSGSLAPTHTDVYRRQWDWGCGFSYLKKYPEYMKQ